MSLTEASKVLLHQGTLWMNNDCYSVRTPSRIHRQYSVQDGWFGLFCFSLGLNASVRRRGHTYIGSTGG